MNFGMIILNQNIKTMQNYATWILTASLFILKLKIFIKISYQYHIISKSYQNHNKDLKVKDIVYILNKSIKLHYVVMALKKYNLLIKL